MKTFKRIVIVLLAIIVILVIVAYILPGSYKVTRTAYIKAPDSVIYKLTSHFNKWNTWTAWTPESDSTVNFTLTGDDGKVGTTRKWDGEALGHGEMTITEVDPNKAFGYDMSFDEGKYKSKGKIVLEPAGDSVKVTWTADGDLGYNPVSRYFGLAMDNMMGPDFEKGLTKLKKVAEERKDWPDITEIEVPEQTVLLIRDSAGPDTYGMVLGRGYGEIMAFAEANKIPMTGHPFAIYIKYDSATMFSVMDMGIPVEKTSAEPKARVRVENIPAHKAIMTRYFGPYDKTASYYYAMEKYCNQEKLEIVGGPWEVYVTDPMVEKDPMKVQTDIIFPVR